MRDTSFLGKLLALTESTNKHEADLAKAKLEQQLEKRGINLEQLEAQLGDMSVVDEEIEVIAFRFGTPYKRIDPAVSTIISAVADYYNGKIVFTPFKFERSGNQKHQKEYIKDSKGDIYRQIEISASCNCLPFFCSSDFILLNLLLTSQAQFFLKLFLCEAPSIAT